MKRFIYGMLLYALFFLTSVVVQAAGPTATLTWVPPTTNTDGSPITGTLTYNIYEGQGASVSTCTVGSTPSQTGLSGTTVTISTGLQDGTTACFAVTAVEGGVESAKSNTATKTFPPATPLAPTLTVS